MKRGQLSDTTIFHFSLSGLLQSEQCIALDTSNGFLALLSSLQEQARVLNVLQFSESELLALLPVLEAYPYYCPYEVLMANLSESVTETAVERWRQKLQDAYAMGIWDQMMRPARNTISRVRLKVNEVGIDITSIVEIGYMLTRVKK